MMLFQVLLLKKKSTIITNNVVVDTHWIGDINFNKIVQAGFTQNCISFICSSKVFIIIFFQMQHYSLIIIQFFINYAFICGVVYSFVSILFLYLFFRAILIKKKK